MQSIARTLVLCTLFSLVSAAGASAEERLAGPLEAAGASAQIGTRPLVVRDEIRPLLTLLDGREVVAFGEAEADGGLRLTGLEAQVLHRGWLSPRGKGQIDLRAMRATAWVQPGKTVRVIDAIAYDQQRKRFCQIAERSGREILFVAVQSGDAAGWLPAYKVRIGTLPARNAGVASGAAQGIAGSLGGDSAAPARADEPVSDAEAARVEAWIRANAGDEDTDLLPAVDSGEEGLRVYVLTGADAERLMRLARAISYVDDGAEFKAGDHVVAIRTTEDEEALGVATIKAGKIRYLGMIGMVDLPYDMSTAKFEGVIGTSIGEAFDGVTELDELSAYDVIDYLVDASRELPSMEEQDEGDE